MPDARIPAPDLAMAEALSALPLEAPDRSAWPALAARIDARQRPPVRRASSRRWLLGAAAAAALGAVALLPRQIDGPADTLPATPAGELAANPTGATAPGVDELMAESARLEYLLGVVTGDSTGSASATALAIEYESRVQQIDVALSDPALTREQRASLWGRRVDLLREHAGLQGTAQWLAAQGREFDGSLVAVF